MGMSANSVAMTLASTHPKKKNMRTIINGLISKAYLFVGVEKISWIVTGLCAKYSGWVLAVPY